MRGFLSRSVAFVLLVTIALDFSQAGAEPEKKAGSHPGHGGKRRARGNRNEDPQETADEDPAAPSRRTSPRRAASPFKDFPC